MIIEYKGFNIYPSSTKGYDKNNPMHIKIIQIHNIAITGSILKYYMKHNGKYINENLELSEINNNYIHDLNGCIYFIKKYIDRLIDGYVSDEHATLHHLIELANNKLSICKISYNMQDMLNIDPSDFKNNILFLLDIIENQ